MSWIAVYPDRKYGWKAERQICAFRFKYTMKSMMCAE